MKVVQIFFLSIGAFVAVVAMLVAILPTKLTLISKVKVNCSPEMAIEKMSDLKRYHQWSPWLLTDPNQKHYVTGQSGEVGSRFYWEGVAEKSAGFMELTQLQNGKHLSYECDIQVPFQSKPKFNYSARATANGSEITLECEMPLGRPFNLISKFIGLEGNVQKINQRGLENFSRMVANELVLQH